MRMRDVLAKERLAVRRGGLRQVAGSQVGGPDGVRLREHQPAAGVESVRCHAHRDRQQEGHEPEDGADDHAGGALRRHRGPAASTSAEPVADLVGGEGHDDEQREEHEDRDPIERLLAHGLTPTSSVVPSAAPQRSARTVAVEQARPAPSVGARRAGVPSEARRQAEAHRRAADPPAAGPLRPRRARRPAPSASGTRPRSHPRPPRGGRARPAMAAAPVPGHRARRSAMATARVTGSVWPMATAMLSAMGSPSAMVMATAWRWRSVTASGSASGIGDGRRRSVMGVGASATGWGCGVGLGVGDRRR